MHTEITKQVIVREMSGEDIPLIEQMYESYRPLGSTLGLPPVDPLLRKVWLANLRSGANLVAYVDGRIAGHLVLLPTGGAAEMIAYVHQDFRRRGIFAAMTRAAIESARRRGFSYVWLLIARTNFAAQLGLQKLRFRIAWQDLHEMQFLFPTTVS